MSNFNSPNHLKNNFGLSQMSSVSILRSRHSIDLSSPVSPNVAYVEREVTSGLILDRQISVKGKEGLCTFTSRCSESLAPLLTFEAAWKGNTPEGNCTYTYLKQPPNNNVDWLEEKHSYDGSLAGGKKNGSGTYTITKKMKDNTEIKSVIHGNWEDDVLVNGRIEKDDDGRPMNLITQDSGSWVRKKARLHTILGSDRLIGDRNLGTNRNLIISSNNSGASKHSINDRLQV